MGIANAKCKKNMAFQAQKPQHVELHYSTITKENINILSKYQFSLLFTRLSFLALHR